MCSYQKKKRAWIKLSLRRYDVWKKVSCHLPRNGFLKTDLGIHEICFERNGDNPRFYEKLENNFPFCILSVRFRAETAPS